MSEIAPVYSFRKRLATSTTFSSDARLIIQSSFATYLPSQPTVSPGVLPRNSSRCGFADVAGDDPIDRAKAGGGSPLTASRLYSVEMSSLQENDRVRAHTPRRMDTRMGCKAEDRVYAAAARP